MNKPDYKWRNMTADPILTDRVIGKRNFCGCGFAATGDDEANDDIPEELPKVNVMNVQAMRYAKTALALIGLFVVGKFLYNKFSGK